ncbi:SDR family oxidoreductase [uncultured Paludibaculum sp.]|uniref:SDR family NAD(P)-dependent oxidoreductase n=1 Tax=uncultured Paludibaculum sp. TaxID=1765020 RepID=UPI002AAADEDE|nr:SDR family oxidoreductase [uncultured Paludibaculum sp.]
MSELTGKVILITGAAKRIGRAIALRLHAEGARVLIHYGGSEREARQTAAECGDAPLFQANLESVDEIRHMFTSIENQLGRLDGLVNNAARFTRIPALEVTEADWDFIHSVNLKSYFFCTQQAALLMQRNSGGQGRIVNISSMGAFMTWPEHVHYSASKAGVVSLTRGFAKALAPGITVNSVAPGVIPFEEKDDPAIVALARSTPARQPGTGEDIADAVVYFLKASNFITGQVLQVDGGMGLR